MPTMKILATTDGSARSQSVIPHAARFASAVDGELLLLRVLSPELDCGNVQAPTRQEAVPIVAERWSGELADILAEAKAIGGGLVEVRRPGEDIYQSILRVVADRGVDIMAMSSRGSGLVRHVVLGSVALRVLGKTPVPILVAGERVADPIRAQKYHIIVTTDGSDDATCALDAVAPLSGHASVEVTLLRIHVPHLGDRGDAVAGAAASLEELREGFANPENVRTMVRTIGPLGGVDTAILSVAAEVGASAIAISTHGHSAKYHVFMGSTALGVLRQSTLPLLLVRSAPAATS